MDKNKYEEEFKDKFIKEQVEHINKQLQYKINIEDIDVVKYKRIDKKELIESFEKSKSKVSTIMTLRKSDPKEVKAAYYRHKNRKTYYGQIFEGRSILELQIEDKTKIPQLSLPYNSEENNNDMTSEVTSFQDNKKEKEENMIINVKPSNIDIEELLENYIPKIKFDDIVYTYETYIDQLTQNYLLKLNTLKNEAMRFIENEDDIDSINKVIEYSIIDDFNTFLKNPIFINPYIKPHILNNLNFTDVSLNPSSYNYIEKVVDSIDLKPIDSIVSYLSSYKFESYVFKQEFTDFAEYIINILKDILILIDRKKCLCLYNYRDETFKSIELFKLSEEILEGTKKYIKENIY
jgi:hypothetical protein